MARLAGPGDAETRFDASTDNAALGWRENWETYYENDWKKETSSYLNRVSKNPKNWSWHKCHNEADKNEIPQLRGHAIADIGNGNLMSIGNKGRSDKIDVYQFNKSFTEFRRVNTKGRSPCCRWSHSVNYIPMINSILFFGGFDSQCNYGDAKLFQLDNNTWADININNVRIEYRAMHSTATRVVPPQYKGDQHKFEWYIFGGQFCNGGPYEYHNDIHKITFYDGKHTDYDSDDDGGGGDEKENDNKKGKKGKTKEKKVGWYKCELLTDDNDTNAPCERSQCYSWISGNYFYVYGGATATTTLNDLWAFDLTSRDWNEIKFNGILHAPKVHKIVPRDFRVHQARKPIYFDAKLNQLILIHYGDLDELQSEYLMYGDTLKEYVARIRSRIDDDDGDDEKNNMKVKRRRVTPVQAATTRGGSIFVLDVLTNEWDIKKCPVSKKAKKLQIPDTRTIRIGTYLCQIGGGYRQRQLAQMRARDPNIVSNYAEWIFMIKIPLERVVITLSWSRERLLWIAHKNNKNNEKCTFQILPKVVVSLVIGFFNFRVCSG